MLAYTVGDGGTGAIALGVFLVFLLLGTLVLKLALDLRSKGRETYRARDYDYERPKAETRAPQRPRPRQSSPKQLYYIREAKPPKSSNNRRPSELKSVSPRNLFVLKPLEEEDTEEV